MQKVSTSNENDQLLLLFQIYRLLPKSTNHTNSKIHEERCPQDFTMMQFEDRLIASEKLKWLRINLRKFEIDPSARIQRRLGIHESTLFTKFVRSLMNLKTNKHNIMILLNSLACLHELKRAYSRICKKYSFERTTRANENLSSLQMRRELWRMKGCFSYEDFLNFYFKVCSIKMGRL